MAIGGGWDTSVWDSDVWESSIWANADAAEEEPEEEPTPGPSGGANIPGGQRVYADQYYLKPEQIEDQEMIEIITALIPILFED